GGGLAAEPRVEAEPERREEGPAALDVRDGELHEEHAARSDGCPPGAGSSRGGRRVRPTTPARRRGPSPPRPAPSRLRSGRRPPPSTRSPPRAGRARARAP